MPLCRESEKKFIFSLLIRHQSAMELEKFSIAECRRVVLLVTLGQMRCTITDEVEIFFTSPCPTASVTNGRPFFFVKFNFYVCTDIEFAAAPGGREDENAAFQLIKCRFESQSRQRIFVVLRMHQFNPKL